MVRYLDKYEFLYKIPSIEISKKCKNVNSKSKMMMFVQKFGGLNGIFTIIDLKV